MAIFTGDDIIFRNRVSPARIGLPPGTVNLCSDESQQEVA